LLGKVLRTARSARSEGDKRSSAHGSVGGGKVVQYKGNFGRPSSSKMNFLPRPGITTLKKPPHLANLHNVFHVSQLRKYVADPSHVLEQDDVQVREDLTMGVGPVRILDSQVKQLRGKEIKTVKVLWDEATQEMTWEMEDVMRKSYPHLFAGKFSFSMTKNSKGGSTVRSTEIN